MLSPHRIRVIRSFFVLAVLVGAAALIAQIAGVSGADKSVGTHLVFGDTTNEWLVQMPKQKSRASSQNQRMGKALGRLGGGKSSVELPGEWYEIKLANEVASADAEAAFGSEGAIDVEPVVPRTIYDFQAEYRSGARNPQRLNEQWALKQSNNIDIDGVEAWSRSTGKGAVVAVIDTGVDAEHPELAGRVLPGHDFSGAATGAHYDAVGHGTAVASIIAAQGLVIAGVAPDAQILPLKVFRDNGGQFSMSGYLAAIRYAADQGVDVINISLGCGGSVSCYSQAEYDAIQYANERGVLVVAAAGNGGANGFGINIDNPNTPDYPSGYDLPNIVSVTANTKLGSLSRWANFGKNSVDVTAPGEDLLVAKNLAAASNNASAAYGAVTGTSFSAPIVSGVAALIKSTERSASSDEVAARIVASASPRAALRGKTISGSMVNAQRAVSNNAKRAAAKTVTTPALTNPKPRAQVTNPPTFTWRLPNRWKAEQFELRGPGGVWRAPLTAKRRAYAQPRSAWRSGNYRWRVIARTAGGAKKSSKWHTYKLAPRADAWVTSGRFSKDGRALRLRIGYAATETKAFTRIRVIANGKVIHSSTNQARTLHTKGKGSPRRGWFRYDAKLKRTVKKRERVIVEVQVKSGRKMVRKKFKATVA